MQRVAWLPGVRKQTRRCSSIVFMVSSSMEMQESQIVDRQPVMSMIIVPFYTKTIYCKEKRQTGEVVQTRQ